MYRPWTLPLHATSITVNKLFSFKIYSANYLVNQEIEILEFFTFYVKTSSDFEALTFHRTARKTYCELQSFPCLLFSED